MIAALFYLQFHSIKNRLTMRLRRLKQPKYLAGAIVGGIYFYFYFFRYLFLSGYRDSAGSASVTPDILALYESLGALVLFVIVLLAWLVPHERAALAFTEAEVAFLFPAPITRRGLIHFKLLRSQVAILFTIIIFTLVSNRIAGGGSIWIHAVGWWVILCTLNLHLLGSSFARTMLLDRGVSNWHRRLGVLVLVAALVGTIFLWAKRTMPTAEATNFTDLTAIKDFFQHALETGPAPYLLYPFRLMVRPFLAADALTFLYALFPALLVMALHYWWVIRSDVAFEEASVEYSRKLTERIAAARAGNWQGAKKIKKGKRAPFKLRPNGPQVTALLWKNLIATGQFFTVRLWLALVWIVFFGTIYLAAATVHSGVSFAISLLVLMLIGMSLLIGPHLLRHDLRQDLPVADVLKMYPMRGWQMVLGELLAPAVILTCVQWLLLILAAGLFTPEKGAIPFATRIAFGFGAAIIVPALNLISLLIPNAAVLLFPAWFQTGKESPQGIEATGQRIILALGQFLAFVIALVPAAIAFAVVFFPVNYLAGMIAAAPLASVAAAVVLAAEAGLAVKLLGQLFERFDLSKELSA